MKKKYMLTNDTIDLNGIVLFRIKAIVNFGGVLAGDPGGYIESEKNLSVSGNAWISGDAMVSGEIFS